MPRDRDYEVADDDDDDLPKRRRRNREDDDDREIRYRIDRPARTGFGAGFGWTSGAFAAVVVIIMLICGGCIAIGVVGYQAVGSSSRSPAK